VLNATVLLTPEQLPSANVRGQAVVVFDVLRATTTMTAALAGGVEEIRVYGRVDAALAAARAETGKKLLCGEINCHPPPGFDLGNSPRDWADDRYAGYRVFMATTNGTRAISAAATMRPSLLLVGAIVNAGAAAQAAANTQAEIVLLCAGTAGRLSIEDLIGAGAVLHHLAGTGGYTIAGDEAHIALYLFEQSRADLAAALRQGAGARNLQTAGLAADIDYCARLDALSVVGVVHEDAGGLACRRLRS
jgi:2-phosphosulfolactate phosphatase